MISPWPNDKCALPVVYWSKSGNSKNLLSTMNLNYVLNSFFHSELKAKRDWQTSRRWWQTWQHDCMPTLHEDSYYLQIWRNCHSCWSWHFQKLQWKKMNIFIRRAWMCTHKVVLHYTVDLTWVSLTFVYIIPINSHIIFKFGYRMIILKIYF